ncbi:Rossmann-fold NAD(P)-binding domain-containing protein [Salipiger thiooxidans]|uniref:epimerase n=1 Tax=Salipiger thiooxidans TaxID=282683 RepID=UPI001CFBB040|nr:epimerase [Salipiger thiooxidans]
MTGKVLILGGHGRFGGHVAQAFWNAGWKVALYRRGTSLRAAAEGADVIVNGWHVPYPRWEAEMPALTDRIIDAARSSGATILQPGNVYVFGEGAPELLGTDTPHRARNRLGRVRIEMEERLRDSGLPVILLRAGDFLDDQPSGNWFDKVMVRDLRKGTLTWLGNPEIPHAWAWLPDLTEAARMLADRRAELPRFADLPFPGFTLSGQEMAAHLGHIVGRDIAIRPLRWWMLQLARPVWGTAGGLLEMRYLWDMPHRLDPAPLATLLPEFRPTPVNEALRRATAHLTAGTGSRTPADAAAPRRAA